jgi:O-antigen ligase
VLLPLVVALVPLIIAPGLLFYFDVTPKVALLLMGVAAALPWFSPCKLTARREGRWLCLLLGAQAVSLIFSTVLSTRARLSVFGTNWRRFGLITQLALLLFTLLAAAELAGDRRRLRWYLRAVATAAIPISLYAMAQYFGWDPWIPKQAYHAGEGIWTIVRPPGTLGYVSYLANYLVFAAFLGAALYSIETPGWWKRAGALAAVLAALAILLSGTRAAMLALALGAVYLWLWFRPPIRARVVAMALGAAAAVALFVASPAGLMLRSRFHWSMEDSTGGARLLLFRDSLTLAAGHLPAGTGPETFSSEFPHVQSAALSRAYPDFYHESPHNIFLDALTAQGVGGALALAGLVWLGFQAARDSRGVEPALAGILGACLFAGLVADQFAVFTAPTALYFYLTVAMLIALGKSDAPASRIPLVIAAPISVAFLVLAGRLLIADRGLEGVRADLNAGDRAAAAIDYSRVRTLGLDADVWYSSQMAEAALKAKDAPEALMRWQQAIESGVRATKTSEDPHNAWYHLAMLHARQNDFEPTEACLRQAIASSPTWFKPHWTLAQVLLAEGRREEAKMEAGLAASLNGGKNPEVVQTLHQIQALGR